RAAGTFPLRIDRSNPLDSNLAEPDLSATLDPGGKLLRIYAVNSTASQRALRFHLKGLASLASGARTFTLRDRDRVNDSEVMNSRDDPERVSVRLARIPTSGSWVYYVFEPFTVTLLELDLEARSGPLPSDR